MKGQNSNYPESLLTSLRGVSFVCPICRFELDVHKESYQCTKCDRAYPLCGGIPDFRVFPDPYLDFKKDYERTESVCAVLDTHNLESLLEYYWSMSNVTPPELRGKYIRSALLGEQKARRIVGILESCMPEKLQTGSEILEIGSGTGNFLAVASADHHQVVGIDIAMRWLHVSRRRFMDKGLTVPALVCCCAEYLPFPDGMFDLAVSSATLEFSRNQEMLISECARCLKKSGSLFINTVNRFSIAKDPYFYLWGVGFLPRSLQVRYVRWRRNADYDNVKPLSIYEFKRITAKHFASGEFKLPDIDYMSLQYFPLLTRLQVHLYKRLKKLAPFRSLLKLFGPGWDAIFYK